MQPGVVFVKTFSIMSQACAIKINLKRDEALMRLHRHDKFGECFIISITISVGKFHRAAMLNRISRTRMVHY